MLAAIPGLLSAILIMLFVREPPMESIRPSAAKPKGEAWALLRDRNIMLCVFISIMLVAYLVILFNFLPVVPDPGARHRSEPHELHHGTFGLASMAVAFLVPGSSDRVGRKPVIIVTALVGLVLPLGTLLTTGTDVVPIMISLAIGSCVSGIFPVAMATIPSEW